MCIIFLMWTQWWSHISLLWCQWRVSTFFKDYIADLCDLDWNIRCVCMCVCVCE